MGHPQSLGIGYLQEQGIVLDEAATFSQEESQRVMQLDLNDAPQQGPQSSPCTTWIHFLLIISSLHLGIAPPGFWQFLVLGKFSRDVYWDEVQPPLLKPISRPQLMLIITFLYYLFQIPLSLDQDLCCCSNLPGKVAQNLRLRCPSPWSPCPSNVMVIVLVHLLSKLNKGIQRATAVITSVSKIFVLQLIYNETSLSF